MTHDGLVKRITRVDERDLVDLRLLGSLGLLPRLSVPTVESLETPVDFQKGIYSTCNLVVLE